MNKFGSFENVVIEEEEPGPLKKVMTVEEYSKLRDETLSESRVNESPRFEPVVDLEESPEILPIVESVPEIKFEPRKIEETVQLKEVREKLAVQPDLAPPEISEETEGGSGETRIIRETNVKYESCPNCGGKGGFFWGLWTCPKCGGSGRTPALNQEWSERKIDVKDHR